MSINREFHHLSLKEVKDECRKMGEKEYQKMIEIFEKRDSGDEDINKTFREFAEYLRLEKKNIFQTKTHGPDTN